MKVKLLISFLFCLSYKIVHAQYYEVKGQVTSKLMEPMAFVNVSVKDNAVLGTTTDVKGNYLIKLKEGSYELIFSFVGYRSVTIPVIVRNKNITQNIILEEESREISGVKISAKKVDRSEEIIKKVIDNKYLYMYSKPYTVNAYIKAIEKETTKVKAKDSIRIANDTSIKKKGASSPNLNRAEIYTTVHFSPPNKLKEERTGVDIRGNKEGLFFLRHTDAEFNFYKNLVDVPNLSESPFLSPLSNSGIIAYKYKMMGYDIVNGRKHYKIKVIPTALGNALVSGELVIIDSLWCIKSLSLKLPKYHMVEYDVFEVKQDYEYTDSGYYLSKQEFIYEAKYGKSKSSGRTVVYYSQYQLDKSFNKKFFNNELSSTSQQAYERDSSFWLTIRPEPLSKEEIAFIRKTDSSKAIREQKSWRDSADREFNRITFKKIFFTGVDNYKREKERYWSFKPLIFVYNPIYIAGPRVSYWVSYYREFKNKKNYSFSPKVSYGLLNEDIKGSFSFSTLYNPFTRSRLSVSAGSDFGIINGFDSWISIFRRSNFFVQDNAYVSHSRELFNGFYVYTGMEYSNRRSINDYAFDERGDSLWSGSNKPVAFDYYKALYANVSLRYVPFQKYIREPYQKLILGSVWPELYTSYRKGINAFGSVIDFDYWEVGMEQEVKIGLLGISKYRLFSGEFLNTRDLRLIDYKFQRAAGPVFFTNPLYSFQGIDTSYSTIKRFLEAHYFHRFNGAILNKIPLIKKLNLIECAGGGFLFTKERKMKYFEGFVGLEKVIRLWRERFKIGVFFVASQSNLFPLTTQFKFTIEYFDKNSNKWNY